MLDLAVNLYYQLFLLENNSETMPKLTLLTIFLPFHLTENNH